MLHRIKALLKTKDQSNSWADVLKGSNVECPCCNNTFITFLPYGLIKRANALCPACGSLERHRLHWHFIYNHLNLGRQQTQIRLLHVAPEKVFYDKFKNLENIDYVPCAKFGEGYEDVYPAGTLNIDITDIAMPDNHFDAIYCSHVLEHIPDDKCAMKELFRVLKPGGWALLQVPLDKERQVTYEDFSITEPLEREKAFGQRDHVRVYGKDYKSRLEHAGFNVDVEPYLNRFSENDVFKYGFMKGEDIYLCSK
jgi:SAM-dependent methyltransferase